MASDVGVYVAGEAICKVGDMVMVEVVEVVMMLILVRIESTE